MFMCRVCCLVVMISKVDGFLLLQIYWDLPLCLANKNVQCGEGRWLEMTGCVDMLLESVSWSSEDDHSLHTNIMLDSEKPIHSISSSSQGTPKQAQFNSFITHDICGCSGVIDLCSYNINGVLFSLPVLSFLIPNATVEIRSMIHAYLFSASCQGNGQRSLTFSLK